MSFISFNFIRPNLTLDVNNPASLVDIERDVIALFGGDNCPNLNGKPKLFFFQACRGEKMDSGAQVVRHCG